MYKFLSLKERKDLKITPSHGMGPGHLLQYLLSWQSNRRRGRHQTLVHHRIGKKSNKWVDPSPLKRIPRVEGAPPSALGILPLPPGGNCQVNFSVWKETWGLDDAVIPFNPILSEVSQFSLNSSTPSFLVSVFEAVSISTFPLGSMTVSSSKCD